MPTSTRVRFFPGCGPPIFCPFCLTGEDDFRHFLSSCPVLWESFAESPMGATCGFREVPPDPPHRLRLVTLTLDCPENPGKKIYSTALSRLFAAPFSRGAEFWPRVTLRVSTTSCRPTFPHISLTSLRNGELGLGPSKSPYELFSPSPQVPPSLIRMVAPPPILAPPGRALGYAPPLTTTPVFIAPWVLVPIISVSYGLLV